jgi:hypothetical protein
MHICTACCSVHCFKTCVRSQPTHVPLYIQQYKHTERCNELRTHKRTTLVDHCPKKSGRSLQTLDVYLLLLCVGSARGLENTSTLLSTVELLLSASIATMRTANSSAQHKSDRTTQQRHSYEVSRLMTKLRQDSSSCSNTARRYDCYC